MQTLNWKASETGEAPCKKKLVQELHHDAGVSVGQCCYQKIRLFEDFLQIQVHIVSSESFNKVVYKGPEREKKIFLYYHDQQYDLIRSMQGFHDFMYTLSKTMYGVKDLESTVLDVEKVLKGITKDFVSAELAENCNIDNDECFNNNLSMCYKGQASLLNIKNCLLMSRWTCDECMLKT